MDLLKIAGITQWIKKIVTIGDLKSVKNVEDGYINVNYMVILIKMKITTPRQLAIDLLDRSICCVQVAAVLSDIDGRIFAWGWNNSGISGMGQHAEQHAIMRANRARLKESTLTTAAKRRKSGNTVISLPCFDCMQILVKAKIGNIEYRNKQGEWCTI